MTLGLSQTTKIDELLVNTIGPGPKMLWMNS